MKIVNGKVTGMAIKPGHGALPPASLFDDVIGKTEEAALEEIKARKFAVRVASRDGKGLPGTCDMHPCRANLWVESGKVTKVTMG